MSKSIMTTYYYPSFLPTSAGTILVIICCYVCCCGCCCCCCNALLLGQSASWSQAPPTTRMPSFPSPWHRFHRNCHLRHSDVALSRRRSRSIRLLFSSADDESDDENENDGGSMPIQQQRTSIYEIGVGIDLGTTNSAVAMMISCNDEEEGGNEQVNDTTG